VRQAKEKGADLVLIHEFFALAQPFEGNPLIVHFARLAAELGVVLPLGYFERAGQSYFNSLAVIDAEGRVLGN
jgi:N-carbamoylputrescine amidase